ncbi:hypothetical protein DFH09DRAFT_285919 [Mycena vulgaris]|nr:hypothetical protein DFH09DRAFT_285919 [Mycena vulgaris]
MPAVLTNTFTSAVRIVVPSPGQTPPNGRRWRPRSTSSRSTRPVGSARNTTDLCKSAHIVHSADLGAVSTLVFAVRTTNRRDVGTSVTGPDGLLFSVLVRFSELGRLWYGELVLRLVLSLVRQAGDRRDLEGHRGPDAPGRCLWRRNLRRELRDSRVVPPVVRRQQVERRNSSPFCSKECSRAPQLPTRAAGSFTPASIKEPVSGACSYSFIWFSVSI